MGIIVTIAILLMSITFAIAAGSKVGSLAEFQDSVYDTVPWIRNQRGVAFAIILVPIFEIILAVWLITGWHQTTALVSAIAALIVFSFSLLPTGIKEHGCGCFGHLTPNRWERVSIAYLRNATLIILAMLAIIFGNTSGLGFWVEAVILSIFATAWHIERRYLSDSSSNQAFSGENHGSQMFRPATDEIANVATIISSDEGLWREVCSLHNELKETFSCRMVLLEPTFPQLEHRAITEEQANSIRIDSISRA